VRRRWGGVRGQRRVVGGLGAHALAVRSQLVELRDVGELIRT
jgi:hypothetical protein